MKEHRQDTVMYVRSSTGRRTLATVRPVLCVLIVLLASACVRQPRVLEPIHKYPPQITAMSSSRAAQLELQQTIPGFVGLSFVPGGTAQVRLLDLSESHRARAVVEKAYASPVASVALSIVVFLQATVAEPDLKAYKTKMRDVLAIPGVVYLDLDESCGCIVVGISSPTAAAQVQAFANTAGVPAAAVKTVASSPFRRKTTLREAMRPAKGGLQVEMTSKLCTLGLVVFHNLLTKKGFLTASHCTEGGQGGSLGTWFAQAGGAWFWADKIGVEQIDPFLFDSSRDPDCPTGRLCRRTDVAFIQLDNGTLGVVGRIARPSQMCSSPGSFCGITLGTPSDELLVNGLAPLPSMGEFRGKIGRTTGWSHGVVTRTCVDTNVSDEAGMDTGITMLCQYFVAATADRGDSGSPVFFFRPQDNTALFDGILWGGSDDNKSYAYSPVDSIILELGSMSLFE
jgi:hypothetical protein